MIPFFFKTQWILCRCSNKSNRFHLKMESDEETAAAIVALLFVKKISQKRKRFMWVKTWLGRRINLGLYETLLQELRFEDKSEYKKLLPQEFDEIFGWTCSRWHNQNKQQICVICYQQIFFPSSTHKCKYSKSCFHSFMF